MSYDSELIGQAIASWRAGTVPDAAEFIAAHPQLMEQKSVVLDLALEEYCLRRKAGEEVEISSFCQRFAGYQDTIARLLEVEQYLHDPATKGLSAVDWPNPGSYYRGFHLIKEIGRGAFSRVFLAEDPNVGDRQVVVKVSCGGDHEARTLGKLSHPHVVPVFSAQCDRATQTSVVCMPYLGETTLADVLAKLKSVPSLPMNRNCIGECAVLSASKDLNGAPRHSNYIDAIVAMGADLADALAYMHENSLLHCDLKPSNILLTFNGRAMLLDFNLSVDAMIDSGRIGGTLAYMAPEQIRATILGDPVARRAINQQTDIYGLGAVLYELLSLRRPFGISTLKATRETNARAVLDERANGIAPIHSANPEVDPKLDALILKCLTSEQSGRPKSAGELGQELRHFLTLSYRSKRWIRRHRTAVSAIEIVVAIALIAVLWWFANRAPYSIREYQSGLRSYEMKAYQVSQDEFAHAIAAAPTAENYFARGMAEVQLADIEGAVNDFRRSLQISATAKAAAMLAYCYCLNGSLELGIAYSDRAIGMHMTTAAVLNNKGYCYLKTGKWTEALDELTQAIDCDTELTDAWQNRAIVNFNLALAGKKPLSEAISDISTAALLAPNDPLICYQAACILATAAKESPEARSLAIDYLEKSATGVSLGNVLKSRMFSALREEPRFEKLATRAWTDPGPKETANVVLPVTSAQLE